MSDVVLSPPSPAATDRTAAEGLLAWEIERFDRVTANLGLDPAMICALHCPRRSLIVEIPLQRADRSMSVLTGYRVQHSNALDPATATPRHPIMLTPDSRRCCDLTAVGRFIDLDPDRRSLLAAENQKPRTALMGPPGPPGGSWR